MTRSEFQQTLRSIGEADKASLIDHKKTYLSLVRIYRIGEPEKVREAQERIGWLEEMIREAA